MRYKKVFFGRKITLQIQCTSCKVWQFDSLQVCCSECGFQFDRTYAEEKPTEYRTQNDPTLLDRRVKRKIRESVFERDDYTCQYCALPCYDSWITNKQHLTIDHRIPVSGGGDSSEENLITACRECNSIKGDRRFDTFEAVRDYILSRKDPKHYTI